MNSVHTNTHQEAIALAVADLRLELERYAGSAPPEVSPAKAPRRGATASEQSSLDRLTATFQLSSFERSVLVSAAAIELDSEFADLCARLYPGLPYPTFELLLNVFPDAHWDALSPSASLRAWRLIIVNGGDGQTLVKTRISVDERVLHFLMGAHCDDERLQGLCRPVNSTGLQLADSQESVVLSAASMWMKGDSTSILQLIGADAATRKTLAAAVAAKVGLGLAEITLPLLPSNPSELHTIARALDREAALSGHALHIPVDEFECGENRLLAVPVLLGCLQAPLILSGHEPHDTAGRCTAHFEAAKPQPDEQRLLWQQALGSRAAELNGSIDRLSGHFRLSATAIATYSAFAASLAPSTSTMNPGSSMLGDALWSICRTQSRSRLDELAQRVDGDANWDDLVLPSGQMSQLRTIAAQMRQRLRVHVSWGFQAGSGRGLGIAAIFSGVSGTGKTTAAEVLASELKLDLYRVDLSHTLSKYIGETAKNLRRIFDAAEEAGAVLLFDEADALFGKRTEVRDSHDRYANTEVSYLLQRMELYPGLAILATNMKQAIDPAFLRRVRFLVQFPFPDQAMREAIWRRSVPARAPVESLDYAGLARLSMTGGNIRNIMLNGAFAAAESGEPIRMAHLLDAARAEGVKLERPPAEHELRGWA